MARNTTELMEEELRKAQAIANAITAEKVEKERERLEAPGRPYRQRLSDLYNDPAAWLETQRPGVERDVQEGTNLVARSLSTQGNPIGSGNALSEMQKYATTALNTGLHGRLEAEKNRLANLAGIPGYNAAAANAGTQAINYLYTPPTQYRTSGGTDIADIAGYGMGWAMGYPGVNVNPNRR